MPDLGALARILGVAPEAVRWHLIALPSWDPRPVEKAPHGRPSVRVTALVRGRVMRAHVVEAESEAAALAQLCTEGVSRG